jgi:hypothetical protein
MSTENLPKIPPLTNLVPSRWYLGTTDNSWAAREKPLSINLLTHATYGAEILGGLDLSLEQVTPKRSSRQTKHLVRNRSFLAKGQEQEVESKNFQSERIHEVGGCKITREKSHKTYAGSPHIKPDEQNILQKDPENP